MGQGFAQRGNCDEVIVKVGRERASYRTEGWFQFGMPMRRQPIDMGSQGTDVVVREACSTTSMPIRRKSLVALALVGQQGRPDLGAATADINAEQPAVEVIEGQADGSLSAPWARDFHEGHTSGKHVVTPYAFVLRFPLEAYRLANRLHGN
ncbi:hypothetical protein D9M71_660310 [compost metagenome]